MSCRDECHTAALMSYKGTKMILRGARISYGGTNVLRPVSYGALVYVAIDVPEYYVAECRGAQIPMQ